MKTKIVMFLISIACLSSCQSQPQKDYVKLVIPVELQDNQQAIDYLQEDVKQLNRFFNSLDQLATDFEEIATIVSKVDTTDKTSIEAVRSDLEAKSEKLGRTFLKVNLSLMWYLGKDLFEDEEATKGIIERLDTEEGIAFRKSMKHIRLQKDTIKIRAETFINRLEALDMGKRTE